MTARMTKAELIADVDRRIDANRMRLLKVAKRVMICGECRREFNLLDPVDSAEWAAGHDCET